MRDKTTMTWIDSAKNFETLESLREYVRKNTGRSGCQLFGIFEKNTRSHIGNIKYEPISTSLNGAVMGVLIGAAHYRGKGVFREVFVPTAKKVSVDYDLDRIFLGVNPANKAAVSAYEKSGFEPYDPNDIEKKTFGDVSMCCRTN